MTNLRDANFILTDGDGVTKRTFGDRLEDEWISVKDFGAIGDGETDDAAAIQAAFDHAYGTYAEPHGYYHWGFPTFGNDIFLNKVVYFPPGDYMVRETLALNLVRGAVLRGAGSYQTRIFWDSEEPEYFSPDSSAPADTVSALLECRGCWLTTVEGLTLDAGGVQQCAMSSVRWNSSDSGSGGFYRDVHFTNSTLNGFFSYGAAMGSERTFVSCRFTNSENGHRLAGYNALNHSFYNCYFADCQRGTDVITGGSTTLFHCRFENNSEWDIYHQMSQVRVVGCHSTSQNFATADGVFMSNTHDSVTPGAFLGGYAIQAGAFKGNYSSNSVLTSGGQVGIHLVGNLFDDPDYLDLVTLPIWINGVPVP